MFLSVLSANFKQARFRQIYLICGAFLLLEITVLFLSHDGAWVGVGLSDGTYWGFVPNALALAQSLDIDIAREDAVACVAVAHTVFFPILALIILRRLLSGEIEGRVSQVSFARGVARLDYFCAKLLVATFVLQGCYILASLGVGLTWSFIYQPDSLVQTAISVVGRVALSCLINESFILFCMAVYAWIDSGPAAAGIIAVSTFAGLVLQMSSTAIVVPVHMGFWIKAGGLVEVWEFALPMLVFSLSSGVAFALLAYCGITRAGKER